MFQKLKMASVVVGILFFLLSLLAVLQFYRFQTLLFEVNSSRISVSAQSLKVAVERSLALGLPIQSNAQLKSMLESAIEKSPDIQSIQLVDEQSDSAKVYWEAGVAPSEADTVRVLDAHRRSRKDMWFDPAHAFSFVQVLSIKDPIGHVVADLVLRVDNSAAKTLLSDARTHLFQYWLVLCLATVAFLAPILIYLFFSLDRLIRSASAILRGEVLSREGARHSEICDLASQVANSSALLKPKSTE
jgi:hypothetical protein